MDFRSKSSGRLLLDGSCDQRIIDLTVAGDERALRGLSEATGTDMAAVRARAKVLGLTPWLVKNCRLTGTQPKMRDCLCCDTRFLSISRHNRMCSPCARRS